ncbi:MAG TPA: glycosyltransferase family 2 protein [Anaerolineales bacterium]|nr:glycosyltransferase family 2 protein [Anaerolineales bacterium]
MKKVSVVIPVWNPGELILHCVSALRQQTYQNLQIVLVDNHSVIPVAQIFQDAQQTISDLLIVTNEVNLGFSGGVNRGIVESDGEYLVILNQDVELFPDAIEKMIDALDDVSVGIVGGTLLYRDQRIQHVGD